MEKLKMEKGLMTLALIFAAVVSYGQTVHLSGTVREAKNGETIIGATVYTIDKLNATISNDFGFYNLQPGKGTYTVVCSCIGFYADTVVVDLSKGSQTVDFNLEEERLTLESSKVVATSRKDVLKLPQMGLKTMEMATIKKVPSLLGETDVIRAIQMVPGVQSPSEGSTGFSVRGGGIDQNLILMDGAPIYNSGHFLGFFSMFNGDAVKNVKLYKGDFPAKYGEKAASVLDISTVDGNMNNFDGNVSIGILTSKIFVEGPIVKSKLSFAFSARRSYVDIFFPLIKQLPESSTVYFGDLNAKLNWVINDKNRLSASVFTSKDKFGIGLPDMGIDNMFFQYSNNTQTIKWSHVFNPKLTSVLTAYNSNYDMGTQVEMEKAGYKWDAGVDETGIRDNYIWHINNNNTMEFGLNLAYFRLSPSNTYPLDSTSAILTELCPKTYAFQPSVYVQMEQKIKALTLRYGLRAATFSTMGETDQYYYNPVTHERDSTVHFKAGQFIKTYFRVDPRLSASYVISDNMSLKAAYARSHQYIQQTAASPSPGLMDVWYSASPNIKPQSTDQVSAGINYNFIDDAIRASAEVYYKHSNNTPDLKDNCGDVIEDIDREGLLRFGTSYSYGVELMVEYDWHNWSGWVGYSWSRAMYNIPEINEGKPYRSPLNHEHSVNVVAMYQINNRMDVSAAWIFYSGAPTTYPVARFKYGNTYVPVYSERNSDNLPDYHRLDLSYTIKGKKTVAGKRWGGEWNFSIYNVYGRHNAWTISNGFNRTTKEMETFKVYLFTIVPSVSYTLHF